MDRCCSCHIHAPCSFCESTCPCGSGCTEVFPCEKCNDIICETCQAKRTSTNNVESNVCCACANDTDI